MEQTSLTSSKTTAPWDVVTEPGPVLVAAIHAGHTIRGSLAPWLEIGETDRLREEDPLTDFFLTAGDTIIRANRSRFEFDLNRPSETAVTTNPEDTWGLRIWKPDMPEREKELSLRLHRQFYDQVARCVDEMIEAHGRILVLDVHSYNHRRAGRDAEPDDPQLSPDIDLGATTLDKDIFGGLLERFGDALRSHPLNGRTLEVGTNIRWKDGGHFPEWLHAKYGDAACVITLEYKKVFMDEWGRSADILALQDLREGFLAAVDEARDWLAEHPAPGQAQRKDRMPA